MVKTGKVGEEEAAAAGEVPIAARAYGPVIELEAPYVAEMARLEMIERHGPAALTSGFRVTTTIDSRAQAAANAAAWRTMLQYERRHGYRRPLERLDATALASDGGVTAALRRHPDRGSVLTAVIEAVGERNARARLRDARTVELAWEDLSWARPALPEDRVGPAPTKASDVVASGDVVYVEPRDGDGYRLAQLPAVGGALVALEPRDGAIAALVGGFDFGASKYNRAVQAHRQPGSAFKPFVYSAALEHGFTPATLINDAPIVLPGGEGTEEWRPQNITRRFYGPTPLREALVRSRNLVSIRLLRATGIGAAVRHVAAFGFGPGALPANLTLALGTGQVTPLEMARGFATFANGGFLVAPYLVESVTDSEGKAVYVAQPPVACSDCSGIPLAPQAISPANAYVMSEIMADVINRGTAQAARSLGRSDLAGKTGTTSDRRDAWFVGYNADLVAAAWIGFDQERSLGEQEEGARTALPMWIQFMERALEGRPEHRLSEPPGVVRMWVSRSTGRPTTVGAGDAVFEAFLEGHVPDPTALAANDELGGEDVEPTNDDGDPLF
jgi:penicillin-binding protein 1A